MTKTEIPGNNGALQATRAHVQSRRALWLVGSLLAALVIAVVAVRRHSHAHARDTGTLERPVPVAVATASVGEIRVILGATGTVTPLNTVLVKTRVDGQLMRVAFAEGQSVAAGDMLAEIDARPYAAQLAQAQGQFDRDQALLHNARLDLERYRLLFAQNSIARQQLDTQNALVRQYEGLLAADRAQVESARLQLSYCRITAPFAGRTGLRQVDPGNIVRAADQNGLVTLSQVDPITVVFSLPEDTLPMLMQRLKGGVELPVDAYNRDRSLKIAAGRLLTVDNRIDPATGTIRMKAQFRNEDGTLFPNQFVNVSLLLDTISEATVIPASAVRRSQSGPFAFVVGTNNTVTMRPLTTGQVDGARVAVLGGIAAGETVVIDGTDKLRDGMLVQVTGHADGAAPNAAGAVARDKTAALN